MPTPATMVVRPAQDADYEPVCRLSEVGNRLHRDGVPWMFKQSSEPARSRSQFADLVTRTDRVVLIADVGEVVGVIFGALRAAPNTTVFHQQSWGVVDELVVDPAWRRGGIGGRLMQAVEEWASERGAPWVELNVYEFNVEARGFYEALGYLPYVTKLRKTRSG